MYLRTTQRRNKDGGVVRYVQVAHNRKVDGVTRAEVLLNLGREDRLDRDGLTRLVASINRYLGEPGPADAVHLVGDHLRVVESRPMGTVHLLDGLWRIPGADDAFGKALGTRRVPPHVERGPFAPVANPAFALLSDLSAAGFARTLPAFPRPPPMAVRPALPGRWRTTGRSMGSPGPKSC